MTAALGGGLADPARDGARAFRAAMEAMARPGTIRELAGAAPPAPLSAAAGTLLLTLADPDTPVFLGGGHDCPDLRAWLAFHAGAPVTPRRADAVFAVGRWESLLPLNDWPSGTPDYPDRSATLIVEWPGLAPGGTRLRGPGIEGTAALVLPDPGMLAWNAARFPLGLDFYFTAGTRIAGLPRSTRIGD